MNFLSYATQDYTRSQSIYAYLGLDNNWFEALLNASPHLITLPAGVSVGELADLPGCVLLGILLLDVLVGEVLHATGVDLVEGPPSLLRRVNLGRGLYRPLEPRGPHPQPGDVLIVEEIREGHSILLASL